MNLFEEYQNILEAISGLKFEVQYLTSGGGDTPYQASNLMRLRTAINILGNISYLKTDIAEVKQTQLFKTGNDKLQLSGIDKNEIETIINRIKIKLLVLKDVAEDFSYFKREDLLYIKLPELQSFDDLSKFSNDLKKSIEIPVIHEDIQGHVEIIAADKGSIILYVALGSILAVKLIAGICWAAAVIRKKSAEAKIFEAHAKTLELKNDAIENLNEAQALQLKNILDSEAKSIANNNYSHEDPETLERLKLSISTIATLIEKGAKIIPMTQDDEVKKAFPDYDRLDLIESAIKQLSQGQN